MKLWLFCLMLGVLPGFGKDRPQEPVPVTLYTKFDHEVPPAVAAAIQQEVGAIMEPIGFSFDWRNLSLANGSKSRSSWPSSPSRVLAAPQTWSRMLPIPGSSVTHVSDGIILPFSDVDCDRIRTFMQKECFTSTPPSGTNSSGAPWAVCWLTRYHFLRIPAGMARAAWAKPRIPSRSCCPTISVLRIGRARLYVRGTGCTRTGLGDRGRLLRKSSYRRIRPALSGTPGGAGGYCRSSHR